MAWENGSFIFPEDCIRWDEGSITKDERTKLAGIEAGAQKNRTIASKIEAETGSVNDKSMTPLRVKEAILKLAPLPAKATSTLDGLMSKEDKSKLDGVASGANNYTHPVTHPPEIISQNTTNRFVTDSEKASWNAKASTTLATNTTDGLMSKEDKSKLDTTMVTIIHGTDASATRPTGAKSVYWIGTVEPTNAMDNDMWIGGV